MRLVGSHLYRTEKTDEAFGNIRRANIKSAARKNITTLVQDVNVPVGVDIDIAGNKLYWTDPQGRIRRANLDGSYIEDVIIGLIAPGQLALAIPEKSPQEPIHHTFKKQIDIHTDTIFSIAFSPDGKQLATASESGGHLWDANTGKHIRTFKGHTGGVRSVAFSPDGERLATGGEDATFRLWELDLDPLAIAAAPVYLDFVPPPEATQVLSNYPNPFNPETWIPYQLAEPANISIAIYTTDGKLVRVLDLGHQPMGIYESRSRAAYWDGRNELAEPVASGVYFYTFTAGDYTSTRKMLIRK